MAEKEKLASDEELILALATGATVAEAAERAGVGQETVYPRLNDVEFQRAMSQARGRAFDAIVGKLAGLGAQAVGTLEQVLQQGSRCEAMRAAKIILELGPRLRMFTEFEQRIAALEAEERKPRSDQDALAKLGKGTGAASGRLPARLDRLEAQRAERNADGRDVADPSGTPDTGTQPPSQPKAAENVSKAEVRWR